MYQEIDWPSITCIACGNCCSSACEHKTGNLCHIHPSLIGKEEALTQRGEGCEMTPAEAFFNLGIYCPPVVEIIEKNHGLRVKPKTIAGIGVVAVDNIDEVRTKFSL